MTFAGGVALAMLLLGAKIEQPAWPDGSVGKFHLLGAGAVGSCVRWNTRVAGAGPCVEVGLAADIPFTDQWRFGAELGFGLMNHSYSTDDGIDRSSGGPEYAALRLMVEYDIFQTFFVRPVVQ